MKKSTRGPARAPAHGERVADSSFEAAFDMTGRVVLVTGGAGGIGRAIAQAFAGRGARVVLADLHRGVGQVAAELAGTGHQGIVADVTRRRDAERAVALAGDRLDVLVNSAGILRPAAAEDVGDEDWEATIAANLTAPFLMARAAFQPLCQSAAGRIINLAGQASVVALDRHLAYCASKAGVLGLTRVLAAEWAKHGITVNAVSPTVTESEWGRGPLAAEAGLDMKRRIPTGRFAQPEEIAMAVLYLASRAAGMITGENLVVDGGYTIQ